MDIKRFELMLVNKVAEWFWEQEFQTPKQQEAYPFQEMKHNYESRSRSITAIIFALLEPVELEVLGDEEVKDIEANQVKHHLQERDILISAIKAGSQFTIKHNQKRQLYQIREEN